MYNAKKKQQTFCGFSMGSNQYCARRVYEMCVYYMKGAPEGSLEVVLWRSLESNLQPLVYIEPATPGLQDISLSPTPQRLLYIYNAWVKVQILNLLGAYKNE